MAVDLYIREADSLRFELSMNNCNERLLHLANEILEKETSTDDLDSWTPGKSNQQASGLPTQLPARTDLPSCTECKDNNSNYPKLEIPSQKNLGALKKGSNIAPPSPGPMTPRRMFAESTIGRSSFQKLLEPSPPQRPSLAPYRIVIRDIKEKLLKTKKRLELLLEDLPCEYDAWDYYETSEQILEPLLLCYESLHSSGSGVLADGRLADFIRRVATFGMGLMKLDLRQESTRHSETLDAITVYLDIGRYSEWNEDKRLEFLTKELKGKRPLVPPTIEVAPDVKEVLDTFRVAAELGSCSFGAYVISMASNLSAPHASLHSSGTIEHDLDSLLC